MLAPRKTLWSTPGVGVEAACQLLRLGAQDKVVDVGCGELRESIDVLLDVDAYTKADNRASEWFAAFEAAKAAILQVHPDPNVFGNRIDEYPITVTVSKGELVMWSGRQQGLFSRNGRRAQADIIAALEEAREQ